MKLLTLNKNQKVVANGQILTVKVLEKTLSLKETVARSQDELLQRAYAISNEITSEIKAQKFPTKKDEKAFRFEQISNKALEPALHSKVCDFLDSYFTEFLKEDIYIVQTLRFDVINGYNVLTIEEHSYFRSGKLFDKQTLAQLKIDQKADAFYLKDTVKSDIKERVITIIKNLCSDFKENREKFQNLNETLEDAKNFITENATIRASLKADIEALRVTL